MRPRTVNVTPHARWKLDSGQPGNKGEHRPRCRCASPKLDVRRRRSKFAIVAPSADALRQASAVDHTERWSVSAEFWLRNQKPAGFLLGWHHETERMRQVCAT